MAKAAIPGAADGAEATDGAGATDAAGATGAAVGAAPRLGDDGHRGRWAATMGRVPGGQCHPDCAAAGRAAGGRWRRAAEAAQHHAEAEERLLHQPLGFENLGVTDGMCSDMGRRSRDEVTEERTRRRQRRRGHGGPQRAGGWRRRRGRRLSQRGGRLGHWRRGAAAGGRRGCHRGHGPGGHARRGLTRWRRVRLAEVRAAHLDDGGAAGVRRRAGGPVGGVRASSRSGRPSTGLGHGLPPGAQAVTAGDVEGQRDVGTTGQAWRPGPSARCRRPPPRTRGSRGRRGRRCFRGSAPAGPAGPRAAP